MVKAKALVTLGFLLWGLFFGGTSVSAAQTLQPEWSAGSAQVTPGQETVFYFTLEGADSLQEGINVLQGTLELDSQIFQLPGQEDFSPQGHWESLKYNPENGQFILFRRTEEGQNGPVFQLTLQAREAFPSGETQVTVKELKLSGGEQDLFPEEMGVRLNVQASLPPVQSSPTEEDSSQEELPLLPSPQTSQTSDERLTWLLCAGAALAMLLCLIPLGKKGRWGKGKKWMTVGVTLLATATLTAGSVYALGGKGDLNGDGQKDYTDVHLLQRHLIALEILSEEKQNGADLNYDGKVTVRDLSLLIKLLENRLDYQVEATSALEKRYYEKQEEILWDFAATVSQGGSLQAAVVNGVEYPVQPSQTAGRYSIRLTAAAESGLQKLHLSRFILTNGRSVKAELEEQIEVLKDVPVLERFLVEEMVQDAQLQTSFFLRDEDAALTGAKLEILQNQSDQWVVKQTFQAAAGENLFLPELEPGDYTFHISAQYHRATGSLPESQEHQGSLAAMKEVLWELDYQFSFTGLTPQNQEGERQTQFEKHQPIYLWFASQNATRFSPAWAVVNGQDYPVESFGEGWRIVLPGWEQAQTLSLQVEQILLENGKAFPIFQDNEAVVQIQKRRPQLQQLSLQEKEGEFALSFLVEDPDRTLASQQLVLENHQGEKVGELTVLPEQLSQGWFQGSIPLTHTGLTQSYTLSIWGDWDLSPDQSQPQTQNLLASRTVAALPRALLQSGSLHPEVVEKQGTVELFYQISHNQTTQPLGAVINRIQYPVQPQPDGSLLVRVTASQQAGSQEFLLTGLVFEGGVKVELHHAQSLRVMNSPPQAEDYQMEDHPQRGEAAFRFTLKDEDQSFLEGKMQLITGDGSTLLGEKALTQAGAQEWYFPLEEETEYRFQVLASWKETKEGDRQQTHQLLLDQPVYLTRDYALEVSQLRAEDGTGRESLYFSKESSIYFSFLVRTSTGLPAVEGKINGKVYTLTSVGEGRYQAVLSAGSQWGEQALTLEEIRLENGKNLPLPSQTALPIEVLKEPPVVEGFSWEEGEQGELRLQFHLSDPDLALLQAKVELRGEDGSLLAQQPVTQGAQSLRFSLSQEESCTVKILADYDLDSNRLEVDANVYQGQLLYSADLPLTGDAIQFKEVTEVKLYYAKEGAGQEIPVLDITQGLPQDPEHYYVCLKMEGLPDYYAAVKEFRREGEDGRVYVLLSQQDGVHYTPQGELSRELAYPLPFREGELFYPLVKEAGELFAQMSANPQWTFRLTEDLDASQISPDRPAVGGTFQGTLDGNGYRILNLPTSLFQTLSGATVKNLILEDAQITTSRSGILAELIQNGSVIQNVFLYRCRIENSVDELGAFAGNLKNSTISQSASVEVTVKGLVAVGGIVGKTHAGGVIENCYVTGKVQGSYDHPTLGARVGGIAGWHGGGVIRNSFTQVQIIAPAQKGNGGLIGGPNTGSPVLENCLSLSGGAGYRIAGFDVLQGAQNLYEYAQSTSVTNINQQNQQQIHLVEDIYQKSFYTDFLHWSEEIWELELVSYGKKPNLKQAPEGDNSYGIPEYSLLTGLEGYQPGREQAYANLAKLMPFSRLSTWVKYGNQLDPSHPLALRAVDYVLPLNADAAVITGVRREDPEQVQSIRVVFRQGEALEYPVRYQKTLGELVAVYQIPGVAAGYQPDSYLGVLSSDLVEETVNRVAAYDYSLHLAQLTQEEESRLYRDYYQQAIQPNLEEFVQALLLTQPEYPTYCSSPGVRELVRQRLSREEELQKLLYSYNYFDKWYGIDFDGARLSQLLFFRGPATGLSPSAADLSQALLSVPSDQRATHRTVVLYNNLLKTHTGQGLSEFLGDLSHRLGGFEDPSDWFAANFRGILREQEPWGGNQALHYRIWDILSGLDEGRKSILLPILTAPQEDMYLISVPSQLLLGSMNRYPEYLNKDGQER